MKLLGSILLSLLLPLAAIAQNEGLPARQNSPEASAAEREMIRRACFAHEMGTHEEEDKPFALPNLDDSDWDTLTLPVPPGTPPPWPDGANGTVWYRHAFVPGEGVPTAWRVGGMSIHLDSKDPGARVYLNGEYASVAFAPDGTLWYYPGHREVQPGTNILAVAFAVKDGIGGLPSGAPEDMAIRMNVGINAMGKMGCEYIVTDEWTIPLAGSWKCRFVPATSNEPTDDNVTPDPSFSPKTQPLSPKTYNL